MTHGPTEEAQGPEDPINLDLERLVDFQLKIGAALLSNMTAQEIADALELHVDPEDLSDVYEAIQNLPTYQTWLEEKTHQAFMT